MRAISALSFVLGSLAIGACAASAATATQSDLQFDPLETSVVATVNALSSASPIPEGTAQPTTNAADPNVEPTLTSVPTDIWGNFPAPTSLSVTEIPPPMPEVGFDSAVYNVLLLGSDERPGGGGFRTDTLMIVSIDPKDDTATLISIPRDLYVYIPGWRMDRINTAMVHGGFEMTLQTILYNFGIPIEAWARIDFSGFVSAIDTLGGINVESTGFTQDECRGDILTYRTGSTYAMDGDEALCYTRMRKSGGDFARMRRQQEVVQAIFAKVLSIDGLARVPALYDEFSNMLIMDINVLDLLPLVPTAAQIGADPSLIRQFTIDRELVDFWRTPGGGSVLLPKRPEIQLMLQEAFGPDEFNSTQ